MKDDDISEFRFNALRAMLNDFLAELRDLVQVERERHETVKRLIDYAKLEERVRRIEETR
jgi:hypothetical protein